MDSRRARLMSGQDCGGSAAFLSAIVTVMFAVAVSSLAFGQQVTDTGSISAPVVQTAANGAGRRQKLRPPNPPQANRLRPTQRLASRES